MKKTAIYLAAVLLAVSCGNNTGDNSAADTGKETAATTVVTTEGYEPDGTVHELTSDTIYTPGVHVPNLTVLDFNAVWCGPCRQLAPVLGDLAREYEGRVTFVSIDIDTYGELFDSFQLGNSIPAVLIMRPDGTTAKYVGTGDLLPAEKFRAIIEENL